MLLVITRLDRHPDQRTNDRAALGAAHQDLQVLVQCRIVEQQPQAALTPIDLRQANRVAQDPILARQAKTAIGLLRSFQEGTARASQVFDAAILGRFLAIVELWEALHGIVNNSIQLYYNPISGKLEPIGFDGEVQTFL